MLLVDGSAPWLQRKRRSSGSLVVSLLASWPVPAGVGLERGVRRWFFYPLKNGRGEPQSKER
jgi:hypothetical protein